jgi:aminoglycoside phosphotransferase (APT) family kinase protein
LPTVLLNRIAEAAFPGRRVVSMEPLGDGLRNANFKLYLDPAREPVVLRIYEHDPSLCRKEADLWRLVSGSVPTPEVIYTEPHGWEDLPPFALLRWVEGITFRELKRTGDRDAIARAAYAAGEMLAAIGRFTFPTPGWIGPVPTVTAPLLEGADPLPRFVDLCLAMEELRRRVPAEWRDRTHALVWRWASRLAGLENDTSLVHGDFNKRNLLVRRTAGRWGVAAVLDWEFAVAGSPLIDIGNFLRYETVARPLAEPHFSAGFVGAGGKLPDDWRRLSQIVELAAICESLSSDRLPDAVIPELVDLLRAAIQQP